jgi:hypothetical protein
MGHDIDTKSYHRWLTEADVAAFVASRKKLDKKNPAKGRVSRLLVGRVA